MSNVIEKALMAALRRLIDGKPRNPDLKQLSRRGGLRVNFTTVAIEAGHSRTLIATKDCRYPQVREAVLEVMQPKKESKSTRAMIKDLRAENKEVKHRNSLLTSYCLALLRRIAALERERKR